MVWTYLGGNFRYKRIVKLEHCKLGRVPELVAELAIPLHTQNLQIDIPAYRQSVPFASKKEASINLPPEV
jgi:hypothetical protein